MTISTSPDSIRSSSFWKPGRSLAGTLPEMGLALTDVSGSIDLQSRPILWCWFGLALRSGLLVFGKWIFHRRSPAQAVFHVQRLGLISPAGVGL
ncbi:hypothetical protein IR016_16445 [Pseudomonas putida]|uniref:hypothetical protein n=1 Tax=Pseudomonas putida TaxID=303 RepID=UPI0018AB26EC|nr:hypothetical protein [Pseudomonas putida]MBF8708378.1 hypothetical protein [Pseudomonas putida]